MNIAGPQQLAQQAVTLDSEDPLQRFREEFHIPLDPVGNPEIYFVGNSLGLQPKLTREYVLGELESWETRGVRGHFEGEFPWMPYHEFLTEAMAEIVGGGATEVVVMNGLTVNLHLMMATFYQPNKRRSKILIEEHAFPSDHFAVESQIRWHGLNPDKEMVVLSPEPGQELLPTEKILQAIEYYQDQIALVLLPGVQYYTGQKFDIPAITSAAHQHNICVGFDLAHAAGNVELKLHDWNVDFAAWCTYKYLNSGPGSVAACFVHERHVANTRLPRLAGWWGQQKETRFQMENVYNPIQTVEGWQVSNPPILSLAAIRASMDVFRRAGMPRLLKKSRELTSFFEHCLKQLLADQVEIVTPADPEQRGCQLSLKIRSNETGKKIYECLESNSIRTDWREPNVIRAAPVPLYNSFDDVFRFVTHLKTILEKQKTQEV